MCGCCQSKSKSTQPPQSDITLDRIDGFDRGKEFKRPNSSGKSPSGTRPRSGDSNYSSESMPNATLIPRPPSVVLDNIPPKWKDSIWCKPRGKTPRAYEVKRKHKLTVTLSSQTASMLPEQV